MKLNKIILGTVQLGNLYGINNTTGKPSEVEAFGILDYCFDSGIQFLDTAEAYGDSQSIIGKYLRKNPKKTFQILTKFKGDSSSILDQLQKTLLDLNVTKVHTYSYHRFSDLNNEAIKKELLEIKSKGLISNIGVSIYTNEELAQAIDLDFINTIQIPFNLLDNWKQRGELILRAKSKGKNIHARSIFLQGLFYKNPDQLPASLIELAPVLCKLRELAKSYQLSINQLALGYALHFQEIDQLLIGVETKKQFQQNLEALNCRLDQELIDQIFQLQIKNPSCLDPRSWK